MLGTAETNEKEAKAVFWRNFLGDHRKIHNINPVMRVNDSMTNREHIEASFDLHNKSSFFLDDFDYL